MRILFYGDSNTWGFNALDKSRQKNRFTRIIKERFREHEILEEGLCGRTLCQEDCYDEDRNGAKMISMVLKTHDPLDVVFIMLGTNDAKRQFSSNAINLEKGIRTLLYKATNPEVYRDGAKMPLFFVVCPPKMNPEYIHNSRTVDNFGKLGYDMLNHSKPFLEKGCQDFNIEVIDTQAVAGIIDGIHMDASGHRQVADVLIHKIESLMEEQR